MEPSMQALVLDTSPFLAMQPLAHLAKAFYTIPEVIAELKDEKTRAYLQSLPFEITIKQPSNESIVAITEFARKTGDLSVLSKTDLKVLALTYMLEKEKNGVSHLRTAPNPPKTSVGKMYTKTAKNATQQKQPATNVETQLAELNIQDTESKPVSESQKPEIGSEKLVENEAEEAEEGECDENECEAELGSAEDEFEGADSENQNISEEHNNETELVSEENNNDPEIVEEDSDEEGWITPKNIAQKKYSSAADTVDTKVDVACMTADFAMQNVLLLMGLNLYTANGKRVKELKSWVLRCYACYKVTKDMDKRFCPSCGNPTLIRTSCGVNADGTVVYYLKKNFQYKLRGTIYSIPAPKGGRHANNIVLREDQKEYARAMHQKDRATKKADWFDPDYDPLAPMKDGKRKGFGGAPTNSVIGMGRRNVNERKKKR